MDFTEYTSIQKRMAKKPNLCNLFQLLATETWKRMEFAHTNDRMDIHEPTITQNLIFAINAHAQRYNLDITFEESTNERTNGNDLELILDYVDSNEVFYAPIQVKRLYQNGRYGAFPHDTQIKKLIDYAEDHNLGSYPNGFPLYLFYNYLKLTNEKKKELVESKNHCGIQDETQYG